MGSEMCIRDRIREQGARPAALGQLTQREVEITQLMAQHLTNKEIAQQLFLSEGTVKQYVNQIYSPNYKLQGTPAPSANGCWSW